MKTLLTLLLLSICLMAFGQPSGITVTDEVRLNQLGLDRKIDLSKGEQLTIKQHEEDVKRYAPILRAFLKRDSVYNYMFLQNTISPHLNVGDTLQTYEIKNNQIFLKLKPKKK